MQVWSKYIFIKIVVQGTKVFTKFNKYLILSLNSFTCLYFNRIAC